MPSSKVRSNNTEPVKLWKESGRTAPSSADWVPITPTPRYLRDERYQLIRDAQDDSVFIICVNQAVRFLRTSGLCILILLNVEPRVARPSQRLKKVAAADFVALRCVMASLQRAISVSSSLMRNSNSGADISDR